MTALSWVTSFVKSKACPSRLSNGSVLAGFQPASPCQRQQQTRKHPAWNSTYLRSVCSRPEEPAPLNLPRRDVLPRQNVPTQLHPEDIKQQICLREAAIKGGKVNNFVLPAWLEVEEEVRMASWPSVALSASANPLSSPPLWGPASSLTLQPMVSCPSELPEGTILCVKGPAEVVTRDLNGKA